MKKLILLFFIGLSFGLILQAQVSKTINVTPGSLYSLLTDNERKTITGLTITGTIDARDFVTIRDHMPKLTKLDLSNVSIAKYIGSEGTRSNETTYDANKIPQSGLYYKVLLTEIKLPESLVTIGSDALCQCNGLTDIVIPPKVKDIEKYAFYYCINLKSIFLPASVISMGVESFALCNMLNSITVESTNPINLYSNYNIFNRNDKDLCVLTVPFGSASTYRNAPVWSEFKNIVEDSKGFIVTTHDIRLGGAPGSKATLSIYSNNEWTASSDKDWLEVNPATGNGDQLLTLTALANPSFMQTRTAIVTISATGVPSQTITVAQDIQPQTPRTLEIIAGNLSSTFTSEELLTIEDLTLTGTIDARDFKTMRDMMPLLVQLDLSKATIVEYNGSEGTNPIGNIDYPANTIPENAFDLRSSLIEKSSLTSIVLPETLTAIGQYSFTNCNALSEVIIPELVTEIGNYAFVGCNNIENITIPTSVTTIGTLAFGIFNGSINVDPGNPNYMSNSGVLFNKAQTELIQCVTSRSGHYEIPATVTKIGDHAFNHCRNLTSVIIPSSVNSIGKYAFNYCAELSTVVIPSSVTFIGESAFYACFALSSIYANSITPVNLDSSPNVFPQANNSTLYVPIGSKSAYQTANQWKNFWNIIEINFDLIANAGTDKEIYEGMLVMLEGSVFVNTSGDPLTYRWTAPEGITLSSETELKPTFFAPEVPHDTEFILSLTVSNGLNYSVTDQVTIRALNIYKTPVAHAGIDQTANENSQVTLDGSASFDPDGQALTYLWTAPYPISLSSRYASKPTFQTPNVSEDLKLIFILQVSNGSFTQTDTVVITVKQINTAPVANAGNDHFRDEGDFIELDGTGSWDNEGDALTYLWTAPAGITLNSTTVARPYFIAPNINKDTVFTLTLVVNDGTINSQPSEVKVMLRQISSILLLLTEVNHVRITFPEVNYKLFKKEGNSFIQKKDSFMVFNDSIRFIVEPGEWIVLASSTSNPAAFIPTYIGNVLNWNEAEIISIPDKTLVYRELLCIKPEITKTGIGKISGFVYENPEGQTKSISISKVENVLLENPVRTALVQLYKKGNATPVASVFTDDQGAYQFEKLEIADYEIIVELPGYLQSERFPVALSENIPATKVWFSVNTSTQVITDKNSIQLSLLKVYPNPTKGIVNINGLTENSRNKIAVYTMDGKLVLKKETNLTSETIDISTQTPGTYVFVINEQRFKILKK